MLAWGGDSRVETIYTRLRGDIARFGCATRDFETPHDLYATAHDLEVTMHGLKTLLDSETTTHDLEPL